MGSLDSVGCRRSSHHEAGCRQNPGAVSQLYRLIDFESGAEIIGSDNKFLHTAVSRRSRRKWKNSTPSRSRRFIISGLTIISLTMDAILPERK